MLYPFCVYDPFLANDLSPVITKFADLNLCSYVEDSLSTPYSPNSYGNSFPLQLLCSFNNLIVYRNNCCKAQVDKSSVAKHAWQQDHNINWNLLKLITTVQQNLPHLVRKSIESLKQHYDTRLLSTERS